MFKNKGMILFTGAVLGFLGVALVRLGNPPNMGVCIACFLRDITGALGLHRAPPVQYLRPEIIGLVLGAWTAALATKNFRPIGGSSTFTRFILGFLAMIGMLVFLGCPVRAILRLAGGDLNALVGLAGLVAGVAAGVAFLNKGFTLGRAAPQNRVNGYLFPLIFGLLLLFLIFRAPFLLFSQQGPGAQHAPWLISLAAGLILGALAQRSRFCTIGGIRDFIMFRDSYLLTGFLAALAVALAGNLLVGAFKLGFTGQPVAHADGLWNFLGMALAGWASTLLGGCPMRQLVAASEGNTDCAATVFGIIFGAAVAHNFGLAASPQGVPLAGQVAVVGGLVVVLAIAWFNAKAPAAAPQTQAKGQKELPPGRAG